MRKLFLLFGLIGSLFLFSRGQEQDLENALLWEISGEQLEHPAYLYGTIHIRDEKVFRFSKAMKAKFEACEAFAMEVLINQSNQMKILTMLMADSNRTLDKVLAPTEYEKVRKFMKDSLQRDLRSLNDFKPFMLISIITQEQFSNDKRLPLDLHLYNKAKEAGKKLIGLETVDEQMNAINNITMEEQVDMLMQAIEDYGEKSGLADTLLDYYLEGNLAKLYEYGQKMKVSEEARAGLIAERNHRMTERIIKYVQKRSTFIAVGALHLPGEEGIIQLLREAGYKVRPVR